MCQCLNMLAVHGHGRGTRLGTCLMCAACAVAIVAWVTSDGLCCQKSLHAKKQTRLCDMKQQSCVANSRQQSRLSTSKVSNGKHNFSQIKIFVCDDRSN